MQGTQDGNGGNLAWQTEEPHEQEGSWLWQRRAHWVRFLQKLASMSKKASAPQTGEQMRLVDGVAGAS
jgi:hypothetical protein